MIRQQVAKAIAFRPGTIVTVDDAERSAPESDAMAANYAVDNLDSQFSAFVNGRAPSPCS